MKHNKKSKTKKVEEESVECAPEKPAPQAKAPAGYDVRMEFSVRVEQTDGTPLAVVSGRQDFPSRLLPELLPSAGEAIAHALQVNVVNPILYQLKHNLEGPLKELARRAFEEENIWGVAALARLQGVSIKEDEEEEQDPAFWDELANEVEEVVEPLPVQDEEVVQPLPGQEEERTGESEVESPPEEPGH